MDLFNYYLHFALQAICNKFAQPCPVICLIWLSSGPIICGLTNGKVRALQIKANKSQSLYASYSLVVSLASNSRGTGFISGHVDGSIIRFLVTTDKDSGESQGKIVTHPVPPSALAWLQGHILAAGCDKRVLAYNSQGKVIKTFDYSRDNGEFEFTVAAASPSGQVRSRSQKISGAFNFCCIYCNILLQAAILGSYNRLRLFVWSSMRNNWEESPPKEINNFYTVTALSWSRDGSRIICGGLGGAVLSFEYGKTNVVVSVIEK